MKLVIAEKPSVAMALASVLGARTRKDGYVEGNGYIVSWCVGHLVGLCDASEYDEKYKKWRYDDLPIVPECWKHRVLEGTKKQFGILKKLMRDSEVDEVICATDAGREGELIFRLVYEQAGCKKPMKRLWISSMEEQAIKDGFASLKDGSCYDSLYQSALCRASVFQAGGSYDDMSRLWAVKLNMLFMIFDIVMGILLLKKKTTKMAYILAITELVYIVLVLVLGGTIGIGAIAFLLALAGAIRIDKKWKQYQEISGGSNQLNHTGNSTAGTTQNNTYTEIHTSETANNGSTWQQAEKNNDFVSADSPKSLEETLNIYKKEKSWSAENDMIETLKNSKVWVPYISEKNQLDILKNGERYYLPVFTSRAEMKEYGKKFSQRELRFSDVMDMAKRSQYALTGLVINAFTDSVILDWNQLGTINPGGDDEEEETMYTR